MIDIDGNAIDFENLDEVRLWLNLLEPRIEGYKVVYMELTKIDLSKEGPLNIEQEI